MAYTIHERGLMASARGATYKDKLGAQGLEVGQVGVALHLVRRQVPVICHGGAHRLRG